MPSTQLGHDMDPSDTSAMLCNSSAQWLHHSAPVAGQSAQLGSLAEPAPHNCSPSAQSLPITAPSLCTTINTASPCGQRLRLGHTTEHDALLRRFGPQWVKEQKAGLLMSIHKPFHLKIHEKQHRALFEPCTFLATASPAEQVGIAFFEDTRPLPS